MTDKDIVVEKTSGFWRVRPLAHWEESQQRWFLETEWRGWWGLGRRQLQDILLTERQVRMLRAKDPHARWHAHEHIQRVLGICIGADSVAELFAVVHIMKGIPQREWNPPTRRYLDLEPSHDTEVSPLR